MNRKDTPKGDEWKKYFKFNEYTDTNKEMIRKDKE